MASWAGDLNDYVRQKSHAVIPMEPTVRYTRRSGGVASTREYNILTNETHKDERSVAILQAQLAKSEDQVKQAITKELRAANHGYNIVSMAPKYGMSEEALALINTKTGTAVPKGKMILPPPGATGQHPFATEFVGEVNKQEEVHVRRPRPQRATNIISHRYVSDHEERVAAERAALLHKLEVKAVVDAPQNPLTGKYRNLDVELAAQQCTSDAEAHKRHLVATQTFKVSQLVGRSEGNAYNILASTQVFHQDRLLAKDKEKIRGLPQRAALRQAWEHQRDADEALFEADGSRHLARTNPERVLEQMRRGHDAITNQPFGLSQSELVAGSVSAVVGVGTAKPPLPMSVLRQPTVIDKLQGSAVDLRTYAKPPQSQALHPDGPRSTHERVFHNTTEPRNSASAVASSTYTYDGRRSLMLPTLPKTTTEKTVRDFQ